MKASAEQLMDARDRRRGAAEDRFLARQAKREKKAEPLVGELCRDGQPVFYVNLQRRDGTLTGRVREFAGLIGYGAAISFLLRNNYV